MDRAIRIRGSTRLTSYDLPLWNSEARAIETDSIWQQGDYKTIPELSRAAWALSPIFMRLPSSPDDWVEKISPQQFPFKFGAIEESGGRTFDTYDWLRQL
jgi:hypothetical protein